MGQSRKAAPEELASRWDVFNFAKDSLYLPVRILVGFARQQADMVRAISVTTVSGESPGQAELIRV